MDREARPAWGGLVTGVSDTGRISLSWLSSIWNVLDVVCLWYRWRAVPSPTVRPERRGATLYPGYGAATTSPMVCLYDSEYCSRSLSWSISI